MPGRRAEIAACLLFWGPVYLVLLPLVPVILGWSVLFPASYERFMKPGR